MTTVLVTSRSFSGGSTDVASRLTAAGLAVVRGPATHAVDDLRDPLREAVAWIAGTGPVTGEHLDLAPNLKVIARYGVGVDAVDLTAARRRGIVVTNTPGANSEAVADHTIALLLACLRGVVAGDRRVRAGDWTVQRTREVSSLRVGIVGAGRIGRAVAARLAGFGATVCGVDPFVPADVMASCGIEPGTDSIPGDVDVVSLHAPGTQRLVDASWLTHAKPGLILVNTARSTLVDEHAIADALLGGQLAGYATDTLLAEGTHGDSPLLRPEIADRVVLTPHSAAQTVESVDRMGSMTVDDVLAVLAGRPPHHPVPMEDDRG